MTFIKACEIRHQCHPPSSEELSTSQFNCYSAVQSGSSGTETRGRRALAPSLNLLTEHPLCLSWRFLSFESVNRAPALPVMAIFVKDTQLLLYKEACTVVKESMCSRTQRQQKIRENRIHMYHSCFVTRIYFFEA